MWINKKEISALNNRKRALAFECLIDLDLQRNCDRIWRAGNVHMDGLTTKERAFLETQWDTLQAVQLNIVKVKERLKRNA